MVVMVVMVATASVRGQVVVGRRGRLVVVVVMRRSGVLVERGVVDDGGRVRVPLVVRVSDDARRTGGSVHALVTAAAATANGMRLQPLCRYVQQRRWLLLLLLWRWCDGGRDRS